MGLKSRIVPPRYIFLALLTAVSGLIFWYSWPLLRVGDHFPSRVQHAVDPAPTAGKDDDSCAFYPRMEELLVVMKTGATELHRKLPIHFSTTLKCVPHYVIYSDMEEDIDGHHVVDTFDATDEELKRDHPEFSFYRKLHQWRAEHDVGLWDPEEDDTKHAWDLDKWKFMPMLYKAYRARPEAKWFVFLEADTCVLWSNILAWLSKFDETESYYIGGQALIGPQVFAHGGAGFFISNPALEKVTRHWAENVADFDELTENEWAGDLVVAKAMGQVGINLTETWPISQGETPYSLDYTNYHWCFPVASWHHMTAKDIQIVWDFEQAWLREEKPLPIRHRDVFESLVEPNMQLEFLLEWDNRAEDWLEEDAEDCRAACEKRSECIQYRYNAETAECHTGKVIRYGDKAKPEESELESGWLLDRIAAIKKDEEPCIRDWILRNGG